MTAWKLAPAIAAGCAVVLKPDPQTPLTALRIAELATEVGIPPGVVNVVPADGPTVGAYLVSHPGVDKVSFTGSTRSGSEVMRLASEPVKRLSLELGGKSPNIVFADANLDDAIPSSAYAIYYSAGQSCDARSRVLVEASIYDDFVARLADAASRVKVGDPFDPETQMGSLISQAHREKVHGYVEQGVGEGAEIVTAGERDRFTPRITFARGALPPASIGLVWSPGGDRTGSGRAIVFTTEARPCRFRDVTQ
jgi:acyl-CoA reductase-like NAD-dependent aldehyde dehydrogenase